MITPICPIPATRTIPSDSESRTYQTVSRLELENGSLRPSSPRTVARQHTPIRRCDTVSLTVCQTVVRFDCCVNMLIAILTLRVG